MENVDVAISVSNLIVEVSTPPSVSVAVDMSGPPGAAGAQGVQGPAGVNGLDGVGIPPGGVPGQFLGKASSSNYDSAWQRDEFHLAFSSQSVVTVTHNLGRYPSTQVFDSAGDECIGDIKHLSNNELSITFSAPFSGTVSCN